MITFLYYRMDLEVVLKNNVPNVEEFLKYLQLTIEFEGQLTKRFERYASKKKEKKERKVGLIVNHRWMRRRRLSIVLNIRSLPVLNLIFIFISIPKTRNYSSVYIRLPTHFV